jgi:hypothetical protein
MFGIYDGKTPNNNTQAVALPGSIKSPRCFKVGMNQRTCHGIILILMAEVIMVHFKLKELSLVPMISKLKSNAIVIIEYFGRAWVELQVLSMIHVIIKHVIRFKI